MAIRIKWDQYETALLIDTFWQIESKPEDKQRLISELSKKLRLKAELAGIEIDDVYRNENGITMQLTPIAHAFFPERPSLTSSVMFERMVKMYKEEKNEFDRILAEANSLLCKDSSLRKELTRRDRFKVWLQEKGYSNGVIDSVCDVLDACSKYCLRRGISQVDFWDIDDKKVFSGVISKLKAVKVFSFAHRKLVKSFYLEAAPTYKKFLGTDCVLSISTRAGVTEAVVDDVKTEVAPEALDSDKDRHYIREDKEKYYRWLIDVKGVSEATSRGYVSAIRSCEEHAKEYISLDCALFSASEENIRNTAKTLFEDKEFREINEKQHNRYVISLRYYLEFMNIEIEQADNSYFMNVSHGNRYSLSADNSVVEVLQKNYPYGFNLESPIELMRFKKKYEEMQGNEVAYTDERLVEEISKSGIEYNKKLYVVSEGAINRIVETVRPYVEKGVMIFYYDDIYNKNEDWLFDEKIVSADMLKAILETKLPSYQHRPNFFIARSKRINEREALIADIITVWGDNVLRSFKELSDSLPFIPLDKIKYALSAGEQFVWDSFETYTRRDIFKCSDDQLEKIRISAEKYCDEKGSATFEELPVDDLVSENYELSETAVIDILFSLLSDQFDRNRKALTKKGEKVSIDNAIQRYCRTLDSCTFAEVEAFSKETVGEVRYPVIVDAINKVMVRVDAETFVADSRVSFDIDGIDKALDTIVKGNVMGMKEITTFGYLPHCGYPWNLFLLESYCRRFSRRFRYDCATANSKNAGAIIRTSFTGNYHEVMAEAVAKSGINLNESDVFDYLIASGLMIKRQYSEMESLINRAIFLREGRQ